MQLINESLLNEVTRQAQENPRLRMNHNFHDSLDAKAQRLLNALEPGTLLPIHRHPHTAETYLLLRGKIKVLYYNDQKELMETVVLEPKSGNYGIHIPKNQWHTLEVLESSSVIFEVKDGPYTPLEEKDVLK